MSSVSSQPRPSVPSATLTPALRIAGSRATPSPSRRLLSRQCTAGLPRAAMRAMSRSLAQTVWTSVVSGPSMPRSAIRSTNDILCQWRDVNACDFVSSTCVCQTSFRSRAKARLTSSSSSVQRCGADGAAI
jgi:hypothetical protein